MVKKRSIMALVENIKSIRGKNKQIINELYTITEETGELIIPNSLSNWVRQTFGSTRAVEKQRIIKVVNNYSYEGAIFNELRAKRPLQAMKTDTNRIIKASEGDAFCFPEEKTPYHKTGRLKNRFGGVTAANIAKDDKYHGIVIFKEHNPLEVSAMALSSYFLLAKEWLDKRYEEDKNAKYPFIMWNCLWKAGASVIHGHLQMSLSEGMHYAGIQFLREVAKKYKSRTKRSYFDDIIKVHDMLGLSRKINKNTFLIAPITPAKDKELWIISNDKFENIAMDIATLIRKYITRLHVESFNVGIIMPPLDNSWKDFPIIVKIIDRGAAHINTSDIGSMELIARHSVITTDPYKVIDKF